MSRLFFSFLGGKIFVSAWLLIYSGICFAGHPMVRVTTAQAVDEGMQSLTPSERMRIGAAIRVGNQYIPHHFDWSAYSVNDEQLLKKWVKEIRPLVNKDADDWHAEYLAHASSVYLEISGQYVDSAAVCSQIELFAFDSNEGDVGLRYRSKIIGAWEVNGLATPTGIIVDENQDYQEVTLHLDKDNKIDYVTQRYAGLMTTITWVVKAYTDYIRHPEWWGDTSRHQTLIKKIRGVEAKACRN